MNDEKYIGTIPGGRVGGSRYRTRAAVIAAGIRGTP